MNEFKKPSSNEWGAPCEVASTDSLSSFAQHGNYADTITSVTPVFTKDEERKIQGMDLRDELEVSLDRASEAEQNDELIESVTVGAEARANQR